MKLPHYPLMAQTDAALLISTREAIDALHQVLDLDPDNAEVHYHLGLVYARQNRPADAMVCFRQSAAADDSYGPAHLALGLMLAESGESAAARVSLQKALQLDPQNDKARKHLALLGQQD